MPEIHAGPYIDVRNIFCQGRQNPILRPNDIVDQIFYCVFVWFFNLLVIICLEIELFRDSCKGNIEFCAI